MAESIKDGESGFIDSQDGEVDHHYARLRAQERARLEQVAAGPSHSRYGWVPYLLIGAALVYWHDHLGDFIWLITLALLIESKIRSDSLHSRIDAILELGTLEMGALQDEESRRVEQSVARDRP